MSAGLRANILVALEQACRAEYNRPFSLLRDKWVDCDNKAARYGATTREVASITRMCTLVQVRRILHVEVSAGLVLIQKSGGTSILWWPVGLMEKLLNEQASAGAPP